MRSQKTADWEGTAVSWSHLPGLTYAQGPLNVVQSWKGSLVHLGHGTSHLAVQLSHQDGLKATQQNHVVHSVSVSGSCVPSVLARSCL